MALSEDKVEKIGKVEKATKPAKELEVVEDLRRLPPDKERFDNLMAQDKPQKPEHTEKIEQSSGGKKNSLFDEVRDLSSKTDNLKVTPPELIAQTQEAINKMETIKGQLQTPGLEIKDSVNTLLRNKISHIDDNIRIALSRTGSEYKETTPAVAPPSGITADNPVMRFLGFMTHGQYQLQTLAMDVERMHLNKQDINPATMLAVQLKMNYVTQELEFFSSLLNKALESTKTIMNVQV
jgi:hypothetical protein